MAFSLKNGNQLGHIMEEHMIFTITMKKIKCSEVCKKNHKENPNMPLKNPKEDLNKWKGIPCSWIGRTDIIKLYQFSLS